MPTVGNISICKLSPFVWCQENIIIDRDQEFQKLFRQASILFLLQNL